MQENTIISTDRNAHEVAGADFLLVVIDQLNTVLRDANVESESQRREICRSFLEKNTDFLDQGWFSGEMDKRYIVLGFAKRTGWTDQDAGQITELNLPATTSFLYESYDAAIEFCFDEMNEDVRAEIKTGNA